MGLLQRAVETYDNLSRYVGVYETGKEPLAPIGHIVTGANIEITVDSEGKFISAQAVDAKIIIPVTEESAGRTSAICPHPLCDGIGYISGCSDADKRMRYIQQLEEWNNSSYCDKKLDAVIKYVKGNTILHDLSAANLLKSDNGSIRNEKDTVCWRIIGIDNSGAVYEDIELMKKYSQFYCERNSMLEKQLCYVTGKIDNVAKQHIKGVVAINGNAKIISANDTSNFTYRGRFLNDAEAANVSYVVSQKAHNTLKWLASSTNQGFIAGGRTFVCWNPKGKTVPRPYSPLFKSEASEKITVSNYREQMNKIIQGHKDELPQGEMVIIAAFDAATSGRLAITYYNELEGSDFVERLMYWDNTCCWNDSLKGVYSPDLKTIVKVAYGTQRGNDDNAKIEIDDEILSQHMQRLISCRVDKAKIPYDIVAGIKGKTGNLQIYNRPNRAKVLFTACAVIRKFLWDYKKEEWEMALETERKDRSYQFGRLLAVLEKAEYDTYKDEKRETNAIRMQSVFVKRPAYATKIILEQLKNSYFAKLNSGTKIYYEKLIGDIMAVISECGDEDFNKPLTETYLLGYYLQKNDFYTKKND